MKVRSSWRVVLLWVALPTGACTFDVSGLSLNSGPLDGRAPVQDVRRGEAIGRDRGLPDRRSPADGGPPIDVGPAPDLAPSIDQVPAPDLAPSIDQAPAPDLAPSIDQAPAPDLAPSIDRGGVQDQRAPPPPCSATFGSGLLGYHLCKEELAACTFYVVSGTQTCKEICRIKKKPCLGGANNAPFTYCKPAGKRGCGEGRFDQICRCAR